MRSYGGMSGETPDDDVGFFEQTRHHGPPDNEVPTPVSVRVILARTDDVVIAITGALVYSSGMSFDVCVRRRRRPDAAELHEVLTGMPHGPVVTGLLVGVEFSDGRTASTLTDPFGAFEGDPDGPILTEAGSSADDTTYDASFWLWPTPSPGRLVIVVACEALGIPETSVSIDADALAAASREALELWPWTPPEPFEPGPRRDELPPGGWFSRQVADPTNND